MSNRTASTSSVQLFLQSFDDAWSHKLESILAVLKDVTPDESIWQHPAYAGEKHMLGLPAPGTVLWQIAHLEHCARHYAQIVRVRPVSEEPKTPSPSASNLPELLVALDRAHHELREVITELSDTDLNGACVLGHSIHSGMSISEFLRMTIRHNSWHAGQMAVARRLYRERA
jgi:uncharacterized damage-inducible protein DinB